MKIILFHPVLLASKKQIHTSKYFLILKLLNDTKLHLLNPITSNLKNIEFIYYFSHNFLTWIDIAPLSCSANFGAPYINHGKTEIVRKRTFENFQIRQRGLTADNILVMTIEELGLAKSELTIGSDEFC
jgi:hypothetical protein